MIVTVTLLTTCIKLLVIPAYRSTDFEVHRNWLAITHSLPITKWYYEDTSQWTLDYPPLFAWLEYLLSFIAIYFDNKMLNINHINYSSNSTVLFQRISVIFTDFLYIFGIYRCCSALQKSWRKDVILPILLITNCGLIMVDHIHFQYNGIMYGVLLMSISYMLQGSLLLSAFWFTVLLNIKHIFIYLAPAYFVYLLRHYCLKGPLSMKNIVSKNTLKHFLFLGSIVISVFLVTYLPFLGHISQIISRLFPFKRGLCHAYWAPNVWAIYNTIDKIGYVTASKLGINFGNQSAASMTGGLVQEFSHSVLPDVHPVVTILLSVLFMSPSMLKLFFLNKQATNFIRCLVICGLTSFLFGWHVHEKAILMTIIPLSILSIMEPSDAKIFLILSTTGHYSLFPLLYPSSLLPVKVLLVLLYSIYAFHSLYKIYPLSICNYTLPLLNPLETMYILGLIGIFLYENVIHYLLGLHKRFEFLPLMITSVYCSVGIIYAWINYYIYFLKYDGVHVRVKSCKHNKNE